MVLRDSHQNFHFENLDILSPGTDYLGILGPYQTLGRNSLTTSDFITISILPIKGWLFQRIGHLGLKPK